MRMTNNILINNLKRNLTYNMQRLSKLDGMLATGKRINKPSDDPTGVVETLRLSSRINETSQYHQNAADAKSWLEATDSALGSLNGILNRFYELTIEGVNGTLEHEDRAAVVAELRQLKEEAITIANTTFGDRYVFGGKNTTEPPYKNGAWNTNLSNAKLNYEIGVGIVIPVNITAEEVFQANVLGNDLFQNLDKIITDMETDNVTELSDVDLDILKKNTDIVLAARAQIGARVNRLEMAQNRLTELEINLTGLQSEVEGIDPAKVILDMKNQENVYRSALSVGARVIQPTLIDFLR